MQNPFPIVVLNCKKLNENRIEKAIINYYKCYEKGDA